MLAIDVLQLASTDVVSRELIGFINSTRIDSRQCANVACPLRNHPPAPINMRTRDRTMTSRLDVVAHVLFIDVNAKMACRQLATSRAPARLLSTRATGYVWPSADRAKAEERQINSVLMAPSCQAISVIVWSLWPGCLATVGGLLSRTINPRIDRDISVVVAPPAGRGTARRCVWAAG